MGSGVLNLGVCGYIHSDSYDINSPVKGNCNVGGIVGMGWGYPALNAKKSTIFNCYNKADIVIDGYGGAAFFGGIAGLGCNITNSYNTSDITVCYSGKGFYLGGIAGSAAKVSQCCNTGNISVVGNTSAVPGVIGPSPSVGGIIT